MTEETWEKCWHIRRMMRFLRSGATQTSPDGRQVRTYHIDPTAEELLYWVVACRNLAFPDDIGVANVADPIDLEQLNKTVDTWATAIPLTEGHPDATPQAFAALFREIVGSPWQKYTADFSAEGMAVAGPRGYVLRLPVPHEVFALAQAAHQPRANGTLDPAVLAVLSDALEEAGLEDETLLFHLRGEWGCPWCEGAGTYQTAENDYEECPHCIGGMLPVRHVPGCWALRLLLGEA